MNALTLSATRRRDQVVILDALSMRKCLTPATFPQLHLRRAIVSALRRSARFSLGVASIILWAFNPVAFRKGGAR